MSGHGGVSLESKLDALIKLQLEEQNQSRHHENLRDRAIGNMSLINSALLAILGALYQAKLEDAPAILEVSKFLIPGIVVLFGLFTCVVSARHSVQAARHWELGRFYREKALPLIGSSLSSERSATAAAFRKSDGLAEFFERRDGLNGKWTRRLWWALPAFMALAGLIMLLAAGYSSIFGKVPDRQPTNVRVQIGADGMLGIAPSTFEQWFEHQRRFTAPLPPPAPAPQE